jgi:hypothetical protein
MCFSFFFFFCLSFFQVRRGLSATKTENLRFPHVHDVVAPRKKGKKKKTFINNYGGKGRNRSPTASPTNVGRMPKSKRAPPLVFFPNKKRLKATKKKSAGAFIIINNETLVWSEKDGGSAFAGGNDGQGDKLSAVFSLYSLSLRGAAFLVFLSFFSNLKSHF